MPDELHHIVHFQQGCLVLQAWFAFQTVFVIMQPADLQSCWAYFGPKLAKGAMWIGLIVVPLANISYFAYHAFLGDLMSEDNLIRPWCMTYAVMGVCELGAYFLIGRLILMILESTFDAAVESERIKLEKLEDDMLEEDEGVGEAKWYGHDIESRDIGNGPYRIGEPLKGKVNNDLYSMIFVSCFRSEYVLELKRKED